MNGGILHAAAALDLLGKMQDTRAQNLANASTVGYRKRVASVQAFASAMRQAAGLTLPDYREDVDHTSGVLTPTGQNLDLALEGKGFFAVETARGVRFTRNGNFALDGQGFLVAHDGARVLGQAGPLQADPARGSLAIDARGEVSQDGEPLGRLRVVEFQNLQRLIPEDSGRFREGPDAEPFESLESRVQQGYLENANVNVVDELVAMIAGLRAFEAAQRALSGIDRTRAEGLDARR